MKPFSVEYSHVIKTFCIFLAVWQGTMPVRSDYQLELLYSKSVYLSDVIIHSTRFRFVGTSRQSKVYSASLTSIMQYFSLLLSFTCNCNKQLLLYILRVWACVCLPISNISLTWFLTPHFVNEVYRRQLWFIFPNVPA